MLQRALAVFLVLVTFWSALAAQESFFEPVEDASVPVLDTATGGPNAANGSIEDHHLDDLPGLDHAQDHPAWFPATRTPSFVDAAHARVSPATDAAPPAFTPGVPERPPRA